MHWFTRASRALFALASIRFARGADFRPLQFLHQAVAVVALAAMAPSMASAQTTITASATNLPNLTRGQTYTYDFGATLSGGTSPYTYVVTTPDFPAGVSFNTSTGIISGVPSCAIANGSFTPVIQVTDSANPAQVVSITLHLNMNGAPASSCSNTVAMTSTNSSSTQAGQAYSQTNVASGGTSPYTYALTSGTLPPGTSLDPNTGTVSGTPTTPGTYTYTITTTDSVGLTTSQTVTVTITAATLTETGTPSSTTQVGAAYSQQNTGSGGTGPYTYSVTAGALPAGTTLNASTGLVSGTPTTTGAFSYTITVTDNNGATATHATTGTIAAPLLTETGTPSSTTQVGAAYSQQNTGNGGTAPYTYSVTAGTLPAGTTLNPSTGLVSGTPTTTGAFSYTITVTDANGATATHATTGTIAPGAVLALGPTTLAAPMQGVAYSASVNATGGSGTGYAYSITAGALPAGLTLNPATGAITGRTTASGTFTFTVRAVDSQGNWGTRVYTMTIAARPDPSLDAEVRGLVDDQFRSADRIAEGQIGNAMSHMEDLHGGLRCGVNNKIKLTGQQTAADPKAGQSAQPRQVAYSCDEANPRIALWAAGSIDQTRENLSRFNANALSFGVDARATDRLIIGLAAGLGFNNSTFGTHGTHGHDTATTGMAYASFKAADGLFIDGVVGKSWIDFSAQRYVTADQSLADQSRKGNVTFGGANLALEEPVGTVLVTGNFRYQYLKTRLAAFSETSSSDFALSYQAANQASQDLTAGLRVETTYLFSWGKLSPSARLEFHHRLAGSYDQVLAYSNLFGTTYDLHVADLSNNLFSATVGARLDLKTIELGAEIGSSSTASSTFAGTAARITVRTKF